MPGLTGLCLASLRRLPAQRAVGNTMAPRNAGGEPGFAGRLGPQAMIDRQGEDAAPPRAGPAGGDQQEGKRIPSSRHRNANRPRSQAAEPVKRLCEACRNGGGL